MPDRQSDLDVHLEDNSGDGGKTFFQGIGKDTLGSDTQLIEAKFFDVRVDPTGFVVKQGDDDLAVAGD